MDDIKRYKGTDPIFSTLPPEVTKVLLHDFRDLIDTDFKIILKHDPLDLPTGIPLIDTVDPKIPDKSEILPLQNSPTIIDANSQEPNIEQLPSNENELELDEENDEIEKIENTENNPNLIIIRGENQKIKKPIMTQNRMQTRQQTKLQEELYNIDEESEPESE